MTPLPTSFRRDGFDFKQRRDFHPVYVYEKSKRDWTGFEVIKARPRGECTLNGRVISARWAYPASEQWGAHGWSYSTLDEALRKAKELTEKETA